MSKEQDPRLPKREIDLSGKAAVVTGGSRGIGRAIAEELGRSGASVVINSRNNPQEALSKIESFGSKGIWLPGDILEEQTRNNLILETINNFGRLDILINNVGMRHDGLFVRTTDEDFLNVLNINLISAASITRLAIKRMMSQRPQGGNIVFIGSLASEGSPGQSLYSAAKAGVVGFAKSLAREYESRNIRVNVVSPGLVETDMVKDLTPKQKSEILRLTGAEKPLKPEEVAESVVLILGNKMRGNKQIIVI